MKLDVDRLQPAPGRSRTARWRPTAAACTRAKGFGVARTRTPIVEYFKLLASSDPQEAARAANRLRESSTASTSRSKRFAGAARPRRLRRASNCQVRSPRLSLCVGPRVARRRRRLLAEITDARWRAEKQRRGPSIPSSAAAGLFVDADGGRLPRGARSTAIEVTASAVRPLASGRLTLDEVRFPFEARAPTPWPTRWRGPSRRMGGGLPARRPPLSSNRACGCRPLSAAHDAVLAG